jgi:hypothetical protein
MSQEPPKAPFPPPPPLPKLINIPWKWLFLFAALAAGGYYGHRFYEKKENERSAEILKQTALKDYQSGKVPQGLTDGKAALERNPGDPEILSMLVSASEGLHSPAAVFYAVKLAKVQSESSNVLALARLAIEHHEPFVAHEILNSLAPQTNTFQFQLLRAEAFLALTNFTAARRSLEIALSIQPQSTQAKIKLIEAELPLSKPDEVDEKLLALVALAQNSETEEQVLQTLLNLQSSFSKWPRLLEIIHSLTGGSSIRSELLKLSLKKLKRESIDANLENLRKITTRPKEIVQLMRWQNLNGLAEQTVAWSERFTNRLELPFVLPLAEALVLNQRWVELDAVYKQSKWDLLEFKRHAYGSLCSKELNQKHDLRPRWDAAMDSAREEVEMLYSLAGLARSWGWTKQEEECLWIIARNPVKQLLALDLLAASYRQAESTKNLFRVIERYYDLKPNDPAARDHYAYVSLLLNQNVEMATRLADENFKLHPSEPSIAATRAFQLNRGKKFREALAVLENISPQEAEMPKVLLQKALALFGLGRPEAREFHLKARHSKSLLPEEDILLSKASELSN